MSNWKRDLAVGITKMHMNETYNRFGDEYYLAYVVDIYDVLDRDIDFLISEVDKKLVGSVLYDDPEITKISEMTYTQVEWEIWNLRRQLRLYRNELQADTDVR